MADEPKKEESLSAIIGKIAVKSIKSEMPGIDQMEGEINDLKSEIKEVKDSIEKERFSAILIIGIFASVITFLSVQVQILANVSNIYQIGFLSFLTITGLFLFLIFIFAIVHFPKNYSFWVLVGIIFILLLSSTILFSFRSLPNPTDTNLIENSTSE